MGKFWQRLSITLSLGGLTALAIAADSVAQSLPTCAPPAAGEYLVLIFTATIAEQETIRLEAGRGLSPHHQAQVCVYGGNVLSRMGGFTSLEAATQWATYVDTAVGLPLMVITPTDTPTSQTTATPPDLIVPTESVVSPAPTTPVSIDAVDNLPAFTPRPLVGGYGILVDYDADPAIANQVKALVGQDLGLVVYATRGYLLVEHTADPARRTALLSLLSNNGLKAIAVPASQLMLLTPSIAP